MLRLIVVTTIFVVASMFPSFVPSVEASAQQEEGSKYTCYRNCATPGRWVSDGSYSYEVCSGESAYAIYDQCIKAVDRNPSAGLYYIPSDTPVQKMLREMGKYGVAPSANQVCSISGCTDTNPVIPYGRMVWTKHCWSKNYCTLVWQWEVYSR